MFPSGVRIRRARAGEASEITAIAVASKASWGYDQAFITTALPELVVNEEDIARDHVDVLEADARLLGYVRLRDLGTEADAAELVDLFVIPEGLGQGHGRRLFEHACAVARAWGRHELRWESDPHAEAFYRHLGAERTGEAASRLFPGRVLPLMRVGL